MILNSLVKMYGISLTDDEKMELGLYVKKVYHMTTKQPTIEKVKLKDMEVCDYPREWMISTGYNVFKKWLWRTDRKELHTIVTDNRYNEKHPKSNKVKIK